MKILEKSTWNRKEHFDFFSDFDEPIFGIVSELNNIKAYQVLKSKKESLFTYYFHKSLIASEPCRRVSLSY